MKHFLLFVLLAVAGTATFAQSPEFQRFISTFPRLTEGTYSLEDVQPLSKKTKPEGAYFEWMYYGLKRIYPSIDTELANTELNGIDIRKKTNEETIFRFFQKFINWHKNDSATVWFKVNGVVCNGGQCISLMTFQLQQIVGPGGMPTQSILISSTDEGVIVDAFAFDWLRYGIDAAGTTKFNWGPNGFIAVVNSITGYGGYSIMPDGCTTTRYMDYWVAGDSGVLAGGRVEYTQTGAFRDTATNEVMLFGQCGDSLLVVYCANALLSTNTVIPSEHYIAHYQANKSMWKPLAILNNRLKKEHKLVVQFPNSPIQYTLQFTQDDATFTSTGSDGSPVQKFVRVPE